MLKAALIAACLVAGAPVWAGDAPASSNDTAAAQKAEAQKTKARKVNCLQSTGTRIQLKKDQCAVSPGRVYSQEDLQRTGAISVNQALRQLDPAFF